MDSNWVESGLKRHLHLKVQFSQLAIRIPLSADSLFKIEFADLGLEFG